MWRCVPSTPPPPFARVTVVWRPAPALQGETLMIPVHTLEFAPAPVDAAAERDRERRERVRKFQAAVGVSNCHESEAMYYLDENNWDLAAALLQYREDAQWAESNPDPNACVALPLRPSPYPFWPRLTVL